VRDAQFLRANTDRMLSMIDSAVAGAAPFLPVRLVVFPEFAHAAPVFATVAELLEKLAVPGKKLEDAGTGMTAGLSCGPSSRESPSDCGTRSISSVRSAST